MVDVRGTIALLNGLREPRSASEVAELLSEPDVALAFPALGLPNELAVRYLVQASDPSKRADLDDTGKQVVGCFLELLGRQAEFERLVRDLGTSEADILATAGRRSHDFLPDSCSLEGVRLVFLPLGLDFRTDRETIYMDPLAALSLGREGIVTTLAHELHHVGRFRQTGVNLTLMRPRALPPDAGLPFVFREWAAWLEAEGIADCVSNLTDTDVPLLHSAVQARRTQMQGYETLLAEALQPFAGGEASRPRPVEELERLRGGLLRIAHPVGARCAQTILATFGRSTLTACVGAPGRFLREYGRANGGEGRVRIDPRLLDLLDEPSG